MTKTRRDGKLFREIAASLRAQPMHYDQTVWGEEASKDVTEHDCGTAHCIAGHAVELRGYKSVGQKWRRVRPSEGGKPLSIVHTAQRLLGLTEDEASDLFSAEWIPAGTVTNNQESADCQLYNRRTLALRAATAMERLANGATVWSVTHPLSRDPFGHATP